MAKTLQPLGALVLVRRHDALEKTEGGIFIPDVGKETPLRATVVAVGPDISDAGDGKPPLLVPGDVVLHKKYEGTELDLNDVKHLVLSMDSIVGKEVDARPGDA